MSSSCFAVACYNIPGRFKHTRNLPEAVITLGQHSRAMVLHLVKHFRLLAMLTINTAQVFRWQQLVLVQ